jgi:type IV pilus assembly protein PilC
LATFRYVVKNAESRTVSGKIAADSKAAVVEELRKRDFTIISVNEIKRAAPAGRRPFQNAKVKTEEIVIFSRQLATMVEAGIPIIQGVDALQEQVSNPTFKRTLASIRDDIQHGSSLSAAFAKHSRIFDPFFVNMVKVGETGGVLNTVLDRVATYMEKTLKLKRKVKAALVYPAVVVTMAVVITVLLLVKVVPTFSGIYDSFDQELPAMTQVLMTVSEILRKHLLYYIGGLIVLVFFARRAHKTRKGRLVIDGAVLKLPVFGDLLRKVALSRFSRTLATLIQSGVPILESLDIVGKTIGNSVLERVVDDVKNAVREGESIAAPLAKNPVFPPMVTRMIAVGEKSGQMEKMLLKISEFYDDQVDTAVDGLTSIIEPLIIGFLGVVIGFIVVALFLPIINITQLI